MTVSCKEFVQIYIRIYIIFYSDQESSATFSQIRSWKRISAVFLTIVLVSAKPCF